MKKSILSYPFANLLLSAFILTSLVILFSCSNDDPVKEDVPELITKVFLLFTPIDGGEPSVASATDPDGEGLQNLKADEDILLEPGRSYELSIMLVNGLLEPTDPAYDLTKEVEEEGDEHMFFFSWSTGAFANPAGNGNIDSRSDVVNYLDEDEGGLPIGLTTLWTTGGARSGDKLRVVLKHQPDQKSAASSSATGETDLDIEFTLNVQ
jgi:hypothetical protein